MIDRATVDALVPTSDDGKTFIERIYDDGFARGQARSLARGLARGVVRILDARGVALSDDERELVLSTTDPAQLDLWVDRAATASTAAEVFAD